MDLNTRCWCPFCEKQMEKIWNPKEKHRLIFKCNCGFMIYYPESLEVYPSLVIKFINERGE